MTAITLPLSRSRENSPVKPDPQTLLKDASTQRLDNMQQLSEIKNSGNRYSSNKKAKRTNPQSKSPLLSINLAEVNFDNESL